MTKEEFINDLFVLEYPQDKWITPSDSWIKSTWISLLVARTLNEYLLNK